MPPSGPSANKATELSARRPSVEDLRRARPIGRDSEPLVAIDAIPCQTGPLKKAEAERAVQGSIAALVLGSKPPNLGEGLVTPRKDPVSPRSTPEKLEPLAPQEKKLTRLRVEGARQKDGDGDVKSPDAKRRKVAEQAAPGVSSVRQRLSHKSPEAKQNVDLVAAEPLVPPSAPPLVPPKGYRLKYLTEFRGSNMATVPITAFENPGPEVSEDVEEAVRMRPRRIRMPPIEHWRNERILMERKPNESAPSVIGVTLNCCPHPNDDPSARTLPVDLPLKRSVLQHADEGITEVLGMSTAAIDVRFVLFPTIWPKSKPPTIALPKADGLVHVDEGSLRLGIHGAEGYNETLLHKGDLFYLTDLPDRCLLAAPVEHPDQAVLKLVQTIARKEPMPLLAS